MTMTIANTHNFVDVLKSLVHMFALHYRVVDEVISILS